MKTFEKISKKKKIKNNVIDFRAYRQYKILVNLPIEKKPTKQFVVDFDA